MSELASVDWSRAQFALTAIYHFLFVPLTLGLSFIIAIMESMYVKTGDIAWKKITRFWMGLFAINFAIGVATGIIMEFEFGTNWANYSWFVGDIFGAPLAVEGILAFFMESTFFAVMFFGWNKVGKKFHLLSTWLVALGSNLSAFWILVANGWMQHPIGMHFNPLTARNEMENFFDVIFSPIAIAKFLHTVSSGYVVSALFVIGISAWFMLQKRDILFAKRSMIVAATFGLLTSLFLTLTGDESAYRVAQNQPVKLAAMEGLYKGESRAGIIAFGILNPNKKIGDDQSEFLGDIELPYMLSLLGYRNVNAFVPGLDDVVNGNEKHHIRPANERIESGKVAIQALSDFRDAKSKNDPLAMQTAEQTLQAHMHDFGYGYFTNPEQIVPPIALTFYSFHIMVSLGMWFIVLFILTLFFALKKEIEKTKPLLYAALWSIPLGYIAAEAGWIVAEVGRQPWAIQDLMPVSVAATHLSSGNIMLSFSLFAVLFTVLLIAEVKIMLKQIVIGPNGGH